MTSDAQGVDIGVLVPPYLPLFKGPGLASGLGHGLFEREMGKSGVSQGSGISGFLQLDVEIWGVVSEPGGVKTPTWTLLLKLEAKE